MTVAVLARLSASDLAYLKSEGDSATRIERKWERRFAEALDQITVRILHDLENLGRVQDQTADELERLVIEHYFDSVESAIEHARGKRPRVQLAGKTKIPDSLATIRRQYDDWRRGKYKPKAASKRGRDLKKKYLERVRSVWEQYSEGFRAGETSTQERVREQIQEAAEVTENRARTIVRTETTSYYSEATQKYYGDSEEITHFLFLAIRDTRTSPWCTPRVVNGKRGRHGLVYAKTDPLLARERPACHPYCRSQILPLSPSNPAHLRLIQDQSIQRRNHQCHPLIRGWGGAA